MKLWSKELLMRVLLGQDVTPEMEDLITSTTTLLPDSICRDCHCIIARRDQSHLNPHSRCTSCDSFSDSIARSLSQQAMKKIYQGKQLGVKRPTSILANSVDQSRKAEISYFQAGFCYHECKFSMFSTQSMRRCT